MEHKPGSIGNAVRDLASAATFRMNNEGLTTDDLEWLDDEIERPSDEAIESRAEWYDTNPIFIEETVPE